MARARLVTRTFNVTEATVMRVEVTTQTVTTEKVVLTGAYTLENALSVIQKKCDTDTLKSVHVLSVNVFEQLYGMSEEEFIKMAKILPPRTSEGDNE